MEGTVERVSKFGFMFDGKWLNLDNAAGITTEGYHAGDVLTIGQNPKGFVTSVKLVTSAPPKADKPAWKGGSSFQKSEPDPERSAKMSRGAAIKAVLESPFVNEKIKNMSDEQALVELFKFSNHVAVYIEKGVA